MDRIEYDKLAWMNELPVPAPPDPKVELSQPYLWLQACQNFSVNNLQNLCLCASQTGQAARFDFQGHLVAADANLPTHLGLHHHGDEPEVALE